MAKDGLTIIRGLNSELEFSSDGTEWAEIPFTGDIEASGGEPPTNEVVTFKRVGQVVGHDRLPSLTAQVPSYVPHHSSWRALAAANQAGNSLQFRIRTKEQELGNSGTGTAAIATSGVVTLNPLVVPTNGNPHPIDWRSELYGVGLGIKIGSAVYTVDTISDDGVLKVDPAPAAHGAVPGADGRDCGVHPAGRRATQQDTGDQPAGATTGLGGRGRMSRE